MRPNLRDQDRDRDRTLETTTETEFRRLETTTKTELLIPRRRPRPKFGSRSQSLFETSTPSVLWSRGRKPWPVRRRESITFRSTERDGSPPPPTMTHRCQRRRRFCYQPALELHHLCSEPQYCPIRVASPCWHLVRWPSLSSPSTISASPDYGSSYRAIAGGNSATKLSANWQLVEYLRQIRFDTVTIGNNNRALWVQPVYCRLLHGNKNRKKWQEKINTKTIISENTTRYG